MRDIIDRQLFGKVEGWTYTIEFQKRGLPHAHCLFILDRANKFNDTDRDEEELLRRIDMVATAEIPDEEREPELNKLVLNHMVHSPCLGRADAVCKVKGKCCRGFPKDYCDRTRVVDDAYPQYRRREVRRTYEKGQSNQYVVPYNKYLLKKYNAHINVEICTSFSAVKYLFKYIYKGYDCAHVQFTSKDGEETVYVDEIKKFIDSRYVSAIEATWRLLSFEMNERSHVVERLPVHLEGEKQVYFQAG